MRNAMATPSKIGPQRGPAGGSACPTCWRLENQLTLPGGAGASACRAALASRYTIFITIVVRNAMEHSVMICDVSPLTKTKRAKEGEVERVYRILKEWLIQCKLPPGESL